MDFKQIFEQSKRDGLNPIWSNRETEKENMKLSFESNYYEFSKKQWSSYTPQENLQTYINMVKKLKGMK